MIPLESTAKNPAIVTSPIRRLANSLIWPRLRGLLTVWRLGVRYGQVKDFEAIHAGVPAADG